MKRNEHDTEPSAPPLPDNQREAPAPAAPGPGVPAGSVSAAAYGKEPVIRERQDDSIDEYFEAWLRVPDAPPQAESAARESGLEDDPYEGYPSVRESPPALPRPGDAHGASRPPRNTFGRRLVASMGTKRGLGIVAVVGALAVVIVGSAIVRTVDEKERPAAPTAASVGSGPKAASTDLPVSSLGTDPSSSQATPMERVPGLVQEPSRARSEPVPVQRTGERSTVTASPLPTAGARPSSPSPSKHSLAATARAASAPPPAAAVPPSSATPVRVYDLLEKER